MAAISISSRFLVRCARSSIPSRNNFQPTTWQCYNDKLKKIEKYLSNLSGVSNHARKTWRKCSKSWASLSHKHQPPKSANYLAGGTLSNLQRHIVRYIVCCRLLYSIVIMQIDATLSGSLKQFATFLNSHIQGQATEDRRKRSSGLKFKTKALFILKHWCPFSGLGSTGNLNHKYISTHNMISHMSECVNELVKKDIRYCCRNP